MMRASICWTLKTLSPFAVWVVLTLAALVAVQPAVAQSTKPLPQLTGRVVDNANMISSGSEAYLEKLLAAHEAKSGNQLVVLTIKSLAGESLEDYSLQVARGWALGQKDLNNGVLFLVAKNDRKMRIEVGYGLEGTLTDGISGYIIRRTIRPAFKAGQFDNGIKRGTAQIVEVLEADKAALQSWKDRTRKTVTSKRNDSPWPFFIIFGVWVMLFFGSFIMSGLIKMFGTQIEPGHYRWLGMDTGPNSPRARRRRHNRRNNSAAGSGWSGGGWSGGSSGGGFSGGGGSFGGGGSSGGW